MKTRRVTWGTALNAWHTYSQDCIAAGRLRGVIRLEGKFWCCVGTTEIPNSPLMRLCAESGGGDYRVDGLPGTWWLWDEHEQWSTDGCYQEILEDGTLPPRDKYESVHYVKEQILLSQTQYDLAYKSYSADRIDSNRIRSVFEWQRKRYVCTSGGNEIITLHTLYSVEQPGPGIVPLQVEDGKFCYEGRIVKCRGKEWVMGPPETEVRVDPSVIELEQVALF